MECKSKMNLFRITVLLWCLAALCSVCGAAEYYASTAGNDTTGDGSINNPYRHIQYTLDNVSTSGDTIILRAGTYNENIRIRNSNITIRSKNDEWAVIQSVINNENKDVAVVFDVDSDGSTLKRVEVIGGYWYGIKFNTKWEWGDPNDRSGACSIIIEDCTIHDTGQACVKVTPGCDDITIRRCEIYNSGRRSPDSAEAIDNVNGDRMLIQECYIHDITATGLYAKGGATGVIIERCLIMNCSGAGILIGFDTSPEWFDTVVNPDYYENIDGIVRNCLIANTQYAGIGLYAAKNAEIFNNTIVDAAQNGHAGLFFGITYQDWEPYANRPPSVNPIIRNNIVVQSQSTNSTTIEIRYDDELGGLSGLSGMPSMGNNCYYVKNGAAFFEDNRPGYEFSGNLSQWQSHISGDMNSIEADPVFVDPASNDYHLSSTSPCIDAGTSNGAPATDYDGILRPQLNAYDMGAYESTEVSHSGTVTFNSPTYNIDEKDGTVAITVIRKDGNSGAVSIEYATSNGTASAGSDYSAASGRLQWADGETDSKTFNVSVKNDPVVESNETINITLSNIDGGAILGSPSAAILTILDDDVTQSAYITYSLWDSQVYRIKAEEGATPENVSLALDALSTLPANGMDRALNISPDGNWLVLETERFGDDCAGWSCLAVVAGDLSTGEAVRSNGSVIHPEGFSAIATGGNLIVYPTHDGSHSVNLWAVTRSSGSDWGVPVELTAASSYAYNNWPAVNADGTKVMFKCTNEPHSDTTCICEVGTDGKGFRVVLTPADSPGDLPDAGDLHSPDYAPDGGIVFEAGWEGEEIWRLPAGATEPVKITNVFNNDNSPCVLPDGRIASLWMDRPGGPGVHELKVMSSDGSNYVMLLPDIDVVDMGIGCGKCVMNIGESASDGDVAPLGSRDGTVNVGDALVTLRFALGLEIPTQEDMIHGDVAPLDESGQPNPDGVINVGDALVILRKALGIVSF